VKSGPVRLACLLLALLSARALVAVCAEPEAAPAPRDRLRFIVQQQCLPHWLNDHDPAPCVSVTPGAAAADPGFAVLPDRKGGAHFLLIPTQTISGVESPAARAPGSLNYFDAAWGARAALDRFVGRAVPRAAVGLAVNQIRSRSQDQLHIHLSCLRAGVAAALRSQAASIGPKWGTLELGDFRYRALRLMGERPGAANPFRLLAESLPDADKSMQDFTLLLAGMDFTEGPGFVLLAGSSVPGAELLLDPGCVLATAQSTN
jgi:CDP-diacylglycerol pyrophosphatase